MKDKTYYISGQPSVSMEHAPAKSFCPKTSFPGFRFRKVLISINHLQFKSFQMIHMIGFQG